MTSLLQVGSLSVLGLAGYSVWRRSEQLARANDSAPLHLDQELASRKYTFSQIQAATSVGDELTSALVELTWADMPPSPPHSTVGKTVSFPDGVVIGYDALFQLNSLAMMNLANNNREAAKPPVVDLGRRTVQTPIAKSAIDAVKTLLIGK